MTEEKFDALGPMFSAIGQEGAHIVGGDPYGLYIYAEPDGGAIYAGVFKDEGNIVRYFDPTEKLFDLIYDAWVAENPDESERWAVLEFEVTGTTLDAQFTYAEELDPESYEVERRRAALEKRYGSKPIIYPPVPDME